MLVHSSGWPLVRWTQRTPECHIPICRPSFELQQAGHRGSISQHRIHSCNISVRICTCRKSAHTRWRARCQLVFPRMSDQCRVHVVLFMGWSMCSPHLMAAHNLNLVCSVQPPPPPPLNNNIHFIQPYFVDFDIWLNKYFTSK